MSHLRFEDDIVLSSDSVEDLQRIPQEVYSEILVVRLKINMNKSKIFYVYVQKAPTLA